MAAGACYQPRSVGFAKSPEERTAKASSAYKYKVAKKPLWIHGSSNSSCTTLSIKARNEELFEKPTSRGPSLSLKARNGELSEEPTSRGPSLSIKARKGELSAKHQNVSHRAKSYVSLLRACAKNKDLHQGTRLHTDILKMGLLEPCADALVTMYAKCGALAKAKELLDMYKSRDVYSWTALISAYVRHGQSLNALNCFERLKLEGLSPDGVTFACALKACGAVKAVDRGKQIHDEISRQGLLDNDIVLGTSLIDMYARCGALTKALCVLKELPSRDVFIWNALIIGYAQQGQGEQALNCFEQMQCEGISPNASTFSCVLKACATIGAIEKGEQIHDQIARQGLLENDIVLGSALVDMYAKCGALEKAQQVLQQLPFRDAFSWSALIAGYAQQGRGEQAVNCFEQMQREGLSPDAVTFACALQACGIIGAVDKGKQIHDEIAKQGLLRKNIVLGTALVDMYAKCGALEKAARVLEELPSRDAISWNSLISGYAKRGEDEQALNCFERMQHEGFSPDAVTYACVLNACSHLGLVEDAHMHFVNMSTKYGVKPTLEQYTCMVDLFGRAGHLEKAVRIIQEMPYSDYSAVWRALLGACRKWRDVKVGKWAFEHAVRLDKRDGAAYVLMANIYSTVGMQEEAKMIEAMQMENRA